MALYREALVEAAMKKRGTRLMMISRDSVLLILFKSNAAPALTNKSLFPSTTLLSCFNLKCIAGKEISQHFLK